MVAFCKDKGAITIACLGSLLKSESLSLRSLSFFLLSSAKEPPWERERERVKECGEIEFFVEKGLLLGKMVRMYDEEEGGIMYRIDVECAMRLR